jgi:hypothetical protein
VGEVASSNLVVPTIYFLYFQWISRENLGPFGQNDHFILSLIGPICPHLIDLFRIAFLVPILLPIDNRTVAR